MLKNRCVQIINNSCSAAVRCRDLVNDYEVLVIVI